MSDHDRFCEPCQTPLLCAHIECPHQTLPQEPPPTFAMGLVLGATFGIVGLVVVLTTFGVIR